MWLVLYIVIPSALSGKDTVYTVNCALVSISEVHLLLTSHNKIQNINYSEGQQFVGIHVTNIAQYMTGTFLYMKLDTLQNFMKNECSMKCL